MFRRHSSPALVPIPDLEAGIAYCGHCGCPVSIYFHLGEMVLVRQTGQRPYYAKVLSVRSEDREPVAIVSINGHETAKVPLASIDKL